MKDKKQNKKSEVVYKTAELENNNRKITTKENIEEQPFSLNVKFQSEA